VRGEAISPAPLDAGGQRQLIDLTKSGYDNEHPRWMMDGKSMIWWSDKFGLHGDGFSSKNQQDIYEMFFSQEAYDQSKLSKVEYDVLNESEAEEKKKKDGETEKTFLFDVDHFPEVAAIVLPKRRRHISEAERQRLADLSKRHGFRPHQSGEPENAPTRRDGKSDPMIVLAVQTSH
jgi:hypothetical protein